MSAAGAGARLTALYLEDDPRDVELAREALAAAGVPVELEVVADRTAYTAALDRGGFDVVLMDYRLPGFDGLDALALAGERRPEVPRVFVSGTVGEDAAVDLVRAGATDFVHKSRIERLPLAVERAVAEAATQRQKASAEARLAAHVRQLYVVAGLAREALAAASLDAFLADAARSVADVFGLEVSGVVELLPSGKELRLRAGVGWREGVVGSARIPAGTGSLCGLGLTLQAPVVSEDLAVETRCGLPRLHAEHGVRAGITVPVDGVGAVCAFARAPRAFTPDEVTFLESVAAVLSQAMARARTEEDLRRSEELHRVIIESINDALFLTDDDGGLRYVCPNVSQVFGRPAGDLAGRSVDDLLEPGLFDPAALEAAGELHNLEAVTVDAAGAEHALLVNVKRVAINGNTRLYVCRDVTEHWAAQTALAASEERLRGAMKAVRMGAWEWDVAADRVEWSDEMFDLLGVDRAGFGHDYAAVRAAVGPEDREAHDRAVQRALADPATERFEGEFRVAGAERWVLSKGTVVRDGAGRAVRMTGIVVDITGRKALEAQLVQSQKMEAVGQLAGGVAHDFNNMLSVILSGAGLALAKADDPEAVRRHLDMVVSAGERSAGLTRQLLAFSRQQLLRPEDSDVDEVLGEAERLLERVIGEDVDLVVRRGAGSARTRIDPHQLQQAVVNMAINSRQAMPGGGRLTVETATASVGAEQGRALELRPGRYVTITVEDTGSGMDAETRRRVFEPFFTTKAAGEGTGLGLAGVHGFVRQSGGAITVYSEPGEGTTFRIYLPQLVAGDEPDAAGERAEPPPPRGAETVLLAEDEELVREILSEVLEEAGYTVLPAATGAEALGLLSGGATRVDLLLTDVVMPDLRGPDLAAAAAQRRPGLPVIFTSGYTRDAVLREGIAAAEVAFLQKPVDSRELLRTVRRLLDEGR